MLIYIKYPSEEVLRTMLIYIKYTSKEVLRWKSGGKRWRSGGGGNVLEKRWKAKIL